MNDKPIPEISKEDWIILRLARTGARSSREFRWSPEFLRTCLYLVDKIGLPAVFAAVDALDREGRT